MSSDFAFVSACPVPVRERNAVLLGHGGGGLLTSRLIESLILPALRNPALEQLDDQALLTLTDGARLAFTTDSYVVTPIVFPGGDIGELAVNGTINDLAMGGARPLALSLAFILEEGFPMQELTRVVGSVRSAASRAGVPVVTGDTKVVGAGSGDGVFINTSGVGIVDSGRPLGSAQVRPGDAVLVSGTIGDHGMAVLACRQGLELAGDLKSDTAALHGLVSLLLAACPEVHAMRDPTRGGLAAVLQEIASRRKLGVHIDETALPVSDAVRRASERFGIDPLFVACEGRLVAFVPEVYAPLALAALREHPLGRRAARIGTVTAAHAGAVVLENAHGGRRVLDLPLTEPLPRIC